jgi:hypothetical protein
VIAELVIADRERRGSDFADVRRWPDRVGGFEDLAFLFSSTLLAHGISTRPRISTVWSGTPTPRPSSRSAGSAAAAPS